MHGRTILFLSYLVLTKPYKNLISLVEDRYSPDELRKRPGRIGQVFFEPTVHLSLVSARHKPVVLGIDDLASPVAAGTTAWP